jgi:hypothetical protein
MVYEMELATTIILIERDAAASVGIGIDEE